MTANQIRKRNQRAEKKTVSFTLTPHSVAGEYFLRVVHKGYECEPDVWWLTIRELRQLKEELQKVT